MSLKGRRATGESSIEEKTKHRVREKELFFSKIEL
jgi:hypothetical protein